MNTERIKFSFRETDHNPYMEGYTLPRMNHWRVRLRYQGRSMSLTFSKGYAHKGAPPTLEEALDCLRSDAALIENTGSFEEFCADLGFDPDSRKELSRYRATERQTERLQTLLGDDFEDFMSMEECEVPQ